MLRFVGGEYEAEAFEGADISLQSMTDKDTFTIGRALNCDLVVSLSTLSREHCKLRFTRGRWFLADTSSTGTWLNDKRMSKNNPQVLKNKDLIKLSPDHLTYEFQELRTEDANNTNLPLSSRPTPDNNFKENATREGNLYKSQMKVLVNKERDKRKQLELVHAADLLALKTKYDEEFRTVRMKLELAKEKKLLLEREQAGWRLEKKSFLLDEDIHTKELDDLRVEYAQKLEDVNCKLQLEITQREKEREMSKQRIKQLDKEQQEFLKEKQEFIVDELQLEEVIEELTEALEQSSTEIATLKNEKNVLQEEKEALTKRVSDLQLNINEIENKNFLESANQLQTFEELMESELQCSICTEIVFNAQTLICGHTFCQLCIDKWREKNPHCPNCRKKVEHTYPSKVLDSFVCKMVDNLTPDFKRKRDEIVGEKDEHCANKRLQVRGFQAEPVAFIDLTSPNRRA